MRNFIHRVVDWSGRHAALVLILAILTVIGSAVFVSPSFPWGLQPRTDFLELLPRNSVGFKAFEHTFDRIGGGASLIVLNESPDRKANERWIDDLASRLGKEVEERKKCHASAPVREAGAPSSPQRDAACGPELIAYIESGTKEVRAFFEAKKWLYADLADLEKADETLDHQIAIGSGMVDDFSRDDDHPPKANTPSGLAPAAPRHQVGPADPGRLSPVAADPDKKPALGMDDFRERWKARASKNDDFPTGYFATPDGRAMGIRIVSTTRGMGEATSDLLLGRVRTLVEELDPKKYHPDMRVGFAGDIPNAVEEKDSLLSEAAWATGMAFLFILWGVVVFFRSAWALPIIALPALLGVGAAYSFANIAYGYVNTSGAFLGAIILGNGINYPIVLLARYNEFRARGMTSDEARREAVVNAFRAELVGALVGGIAYGSLVITNFRGFSQFGTIGFVGMLLVWVTMIPIVPALIVLVERLRSRFPSLTEAPQAVMRLVPWLFPEPRADGEGGRLIRTIAAVTTKVPWLFLGMAAIASAVCAHKLPGFLKDPWEYNFDHLGSRGSKSTGAGVWSLKAEKVFGGKMNIAGAQMLADTPEQVPFIKKKILENDAKDPEGKLVADIVTVDDLLPGTIAEQKAKMEVLERIRERLTPGVLSRMTPDERARIEEMKPPEKLAPVVPKDLPALLRRRFEENNGVVGTVFYVKFKDLSFSDGHILLRIAKTTDNVKLDDGTVVMTASRSTIFAEMIHSMERDGPLATFASLAAVAVVVILATATFRGAAAVLVSLIMGVLWAVGFGALGGMKLNFLNFIALPITFGIGCEYPFNVYDRTRLLRGDVRQALARTGGAVALCSYTTTVGYGSLLVADNQALQSFGRLAMSGEIACILAAIFVLPSLLQVWGAKPPPAAPPA